MDEIKTMKKVVSTYSGLGDLEEIGSVQLRLMRMKKKMGQLHGMQERRTASSNEEYSRKESKHSESKDDGSLGRSVRDGSLENTKRSKSSKKETLALP